MKSLVVFYSRSGNTKKLAQAVAKKEGAGIYEVKETKPHSFLWTITAGLMAGKRKKKALVEPIRINLSAYDKLILMGPIWAGKPAPAMNNVFEAVPAGKDVDVRMVSASGTSKAKADVEALLTKKGAKSVVYSDIKR